MNAVDGSEHFENATTDEQRPALLTIILDTNPAAWALLSGALPLSKVVADLLVFINAHLAGNYTNQVAVIASHCDKAQWLYPTPTEQKLPGGQKSHQPRGERDVAMTDDEPPTPSKRARHDKSAREINGTHLANHESNKYRPFRIVEEQLLRSLQRLLDSTSPDAVSTYSSTMIAGALTLALSYINRENIAYNESITGANPNLADPSSTQAITTEGSGIGNSLTNALQSRILLLTISPSTDLAHQYIPIMNSIFACQRLNIPIDVLQLPLPSAGTNPPPASTASSSSPNSDSTVFLQQASATTNGIYIPARLSFPPSSSSELAHQKINTSTLLTYLLTALLPPPQTRAQLILPTRTDVDFRAACFCHRNIIDIGYVCSICLSIFCSIPGLDNGMDTNGNTAMTTQGFSKDQEGECLTCGTKLSLDGLGGVPVVVPPRKKKKKIRTEGGSGVGTPSRA